MVAATVSLLNDWANSVHKWLSGEYAKKLHNRELNEDKMRVSIYALRRAPAGGADSGAFGTQLT